MKFQELPHLTCRPTALRGRDCTNLSVDLGSRGDAPAPLSVLILAVAAWDRGTTFDCLVSSRLLTSSPHYDLRNNPFRFLFPPRCPALNPTCKVNGGLYVPLFKNGRSGCCKRLVKLPAGRDVSLNVEGGCRLLRCCLRPDGVVGVSLALGCSSVLGYKHTKDRPLSWFFKRTDREREKKALHREAGTEIFIMVTA